MYNTRWWDIAVAAGLAAIAALSLAGLGASGPSGWLSQQCSKNG